MLDLIRYNYSLTICVRMCHLSCLGKRSQTCVAVIVGVWVSNSEWESIESHSSHAEAEVVFSSVAYVVGGYLGTDVTQCIAQHIELPTPTPP